jgi:hypothetical protein
MGYYNAVADYCYLLLLGFLAVNWVSGWAFQDWHGHVRARQYRALCDACRDAEHQFFGPSGYAVQCAYEWDVNLPSRVVTSGFYIYFVPISAEHCKLQETRHGDSGKAERHGYHRIQLFRTNNGRCFSWNPFSVSYLESLPSLPTLLQQTPEDENQELWTRFWSQMLSASRHYLWIYRVFFPTLKVVLVLIALQYDPWIPILLHLVLLCVACIPMIYKMRRLPPETHDRASLSQLAERYANEFAHRGYHVEYRQCYEFDERSNMSAVHYVYVFPLPATAAAAVHDNGSELV